VEAGLKNLIETAGGGVAAGGSVGGKRKGVGGASGSSRSGPKRCQHRGLESTPVDPPYGDGAEEDSESQLSSVPEGI